MFPGVEKWFRDYGKGMRYAVYSGLLTATDIKYCYFDVMEDNRISSGELSVLLGLGLFAGILLDRTWESVRDTYRMRKMEKMETNSIQ